MGRQSKRDWAVFAAVAFIALLLALYFLPSLLARPGLTLDSDLVIKFSDGSTAVTSTSQSLLEKLSVIQSNGKTIDSISTNVYCTWKSSPAGQSVKVQYWVVWYLDITGTMFTGGRAYSSLFGFIDTPLNTFSGTATTNRWYYVSNNIGWGGEFASRFYRERGSGLQVGELNIGPELAYAVSEGLKGVPIANELAEKLTALLAVTTASDGQRIDLISWSRKGYEFYVDLKRSNFAGASLQLGDFTIGAGNWLRMNDGDSYVIKFNVGYFVRYQDLTGEWTKWKSGTVTVATLNVNVAQGQFVNMGLTVGGGVTVTP